MSRIGIKIQINKIQIKPNPRWNRYMLNYCSSTLPASMTTPGACKRRHEASANPQGLMRATWSSMSPVIESMARAPRLGCVLGWCGCQTTLIFDPDGVAMGRGWWGTGALSSKFFSAQVLLLVLHQQCRLMMLLLAIVGTLGLVLASCYLSQLSSVLVHSLIRIF